MKNYYSRSQGTARLGLHFSIAIVSFLISLSAISQNIGINSNGTSPDNSAGLDVDFNDKGILIPRLTTAERDAISSPAIGLMIYNKDCNIFQFRDNANWVSFGCIGCNTSTQVTIATAGLDQSLTCGNDFTTLEGNTASIGTGIWTVVSGAATITDPADPTSEVTSLTTPGTVVLRWTISNDCSSSYDEVEITTCSFSCGDVLVDFS